MLVDLESRYQSHMIPGKFTKLYYTILAMNTWKMKFMNFMYTYLAAILLDIAIISIFWCSQP